MVAHCLYRTVFVGAVLARLVHLRQVHPLKVQFLLDWCNFLLWQAAKPSGDKCTP